MDRNRRQATTPGEIIHPGNEWTVGVMEIAANFGKCHCRSSPSPTHCFPRFPAIVPRTMRPQTILLLVARLTPGFLA